MNSSSSTRKVKYHSTDAGRLDVISGLLIAFAVVYSAFVMVNMIKLDPSLAEKYERMMLTGVAGICLHMVGALFARGEYHPPSQKAICVAIGIFIAVGYIGVMISWGYAFYPFAEELSRTQKAMFYQVAAITEELFFCFGLYSMHINIMRTPFAEYIANVLVSIAFALFHLAVYGVAKGILLLLFISRFLLNLGYWYTQRISTPMIAHCMINLAASLGV